MPTFDSPHDWQLLMEVRLPPDAQQRYLDDREQHAEQKLYSFDPKEFVIPDLLGDDSHESGHGAAASTITGAFVRGHFEKPDGVRVTGKDVPVAVVRIVHARRFDPDAAPLATLEYILFGKGDDLFLAHRITQPPDFDHLLSARIEGRELTDDELAAGVPVRITGRKNVVAERLEPGRPSPATAEVGGQPVPVTVAAQDEFFLDSEFLG
ncbi:MAG: hypothetical protein ACRD12_05935 [Acidimicrobiales bacterium]